MHDRVAPEPVEQLGRHQPEPDRPAMAIGNSKTAPIASDMLIANPAYSLNENIGSSAADWILVNIFSVSGRMKNHESATPARKSNAPQMSTGMTTRFSCLYSAGERKPQTCHRITGDAMIVPSDSDAGHQRSEMGPRGA